MLLAKFQGYMYGGRPLSEYLTHPLMHLELKPCLLQTSCSTIVGMLSPAVPQKVLPAMASPF
jgi:hypothetical protein